MGELSLTEQVTGARIEEGSPANYTLPFIKVNLIMIVLMSIRSYEPESTLNLFCLGTERSAYWSNHFVFEDLKLEADTECMTCYPIIIIFPNVLMINNNEKQSKENHLILGS